MKFINKRAGVSGLVLGACLLALMPLAPASSTSQMGDLPLSHSWGSSWNPSFTYSQGGGSWQGSWTNSWQHSWTNTWHQSWSNTWQPTWTHTWQSWSHTWQPTWTHTWQSWTNTWQPTWTNTWTATWHTWYSPTWSPTYTWTQYAPSYTWAQPYPGCNPYYGYCNGGYYPPPPYPSNYNQVGLTPAVAGPGSHVSIQGTGFLPTDTTCTISSPNTPGLIFNGTAACVIQAGTGFAIGGFIVGNVLPGSYLVQITGNEGDSAQAVLVVE